MLGIYHPAPEAEQKPAKQHVKAEYQPVEILGRQVPTIETPDGIRAAKDDKPISPSSVEAYLQRSFGDDLQRVTDAMKELAESHDPADLDRDAYRLYERFRPQIASGQRGWGQKGTLDLGKIRGGTR